jgi:hypothetical protein
VQSPAVVFGNNADSHKGQKFMHYAKQYSGSGSFLSAQKIAERWAKDGFLSIVVRVDGGLYKASQWEPEKFIQAFKKDEDVLSEMRSLNHTYGFGEPEELLSIHDCEVYLAHDTWLDGARVCKGTPNSYEWEKSATDVEAIQDYFKLLTTIA